MAKLPPFRDVMPGATLTDREGLEYRVMARYKKPLCSLPGAQKRTVLLVRRAKDGRKVEVPGLDYARYAERVVPSKIRKRTKPAPRVRRRKTDA